MKQQQKAETKRFNDQKKRTLDDCKQRAENPKSPESAKSATKQK